MILVRGDPLINTFLELLKNLNFCIFGQVFGQIFPCAKRVQWIQQVSSKYVQGNLEV